MVLNNDVPVSNNYYLFNRFYIYYSEISLIDDTIKFWTLSIFKVIAIVVFLYNN
jgi:hypothetical protein